MEIQNLEINILYCMCDPLNGRHQDGACDTKDMIEEFSDIPAGVVIREIQSMAKKGLIAFDRSRPRMAITVSGISRLQSSIACRINRLDRCRCSRIG